MAGNVEEWVSDWYDPTYYPRSPTTDPMGGPCGPHRVRRGGTYLYIVDFMRCSQRGDMDPPGATVSLGFRCARSVGARLDGGPSDASDLDAECTFDASIIDAAISQ
jgi:formylglycine-generating enzyme required for sulfatase activity